MGVPIREQRLLLQRSGNRCAFPECRRVLTAESSFPDRDVVLGEIAHIVAESPNGPRGQSPLTLDERNSYPNLLLLCNIHHQLIDDQVHTFTVERLQHIKQAHEAWVEKQLANSNIDVDSSVLPMKCETVYSTLLPIERLPRFVYGAPCALTDESLIRTQLHPTDREQMLPFILRGGQLWAFQELTDPQNPFRDVINPEQAQRYLLHSWWDDEDHYKWFVQLVNRALNKLTGRNGLNFDRDHKRYYFDQKIQDQERRVSYRSLNGRRAQRKVVWKPKSKKTGLARGYWYHRAVSLQLLRLTAQQWAIAVRPELRVTVDGQTSIASENVGSKVTRKKSRMFNYDLLGEIQFWRDYLGNSRSQIVLPFSDKQRMIISTNIMEGQVTWPGIPEEHAKPFTNVEYVDDLFSWAELIEDEDQQPGNDDEEWEDDDDDDLFDA